MARFYKTASANPMDYMYRIPTQMMLSVLQNTEGQIDNVNNQAALLNNALAKVNYLTSDEARVKEIITGYNKDVDGITKGLKEDPLQWRKYLPNIQDLGRKIQADFQTGDLGKIQANYNLYQEFNKSVSDMEKAGKLNPLTGQAFRNKALEDYKGFYDPEKKIYNRLNAEKPIADMDLNDWMDKQLKHLKASGQLVWNSQAGMYMSKTENGWEGIRPEKVFDILTKSVGGDNNLMSYLNQRQRFGILNNIFDENGNIQIMDGEGKFINNALTNAMQGAMGEYSFMKTKGGTTLSSNSLYNIGVQHQNAIQMEGIKEQYRIAGDAREHAYDKDLKDYELAQKKDYLDYEQQYKTPGSTGETTVDENGNTVPKNATVYQNIGQGVLSVNPLGGPNTVIKNTDLAKGIDNTKNEIAQLTLARNKYKEGTQDYKLYDDKIHRAEEKLFGFRELYSNAVDAGRKSVGTDDYNFMISMENGGLDKAKEESKRYQQQIGSSQNALKDPYAYNKKQSSVTYDNGKYVVTEGMTPTQSFYDGQMKLREVQGQIARYNKIRAKYDKARQKHLTDNSKRTNFTVDLVKPTTKQANDILSSLSGDRYDFDIYDPMTGQSTSTSKFNTGWIKKGNQFTFSGADDEKNIWGYLQDKGLKIEDVMEIQGLAGPVGYGQGTKAVVRFKGLPDINENKDYTIELPRSVETRLANSINGKDPASLSLKKDITQSQRKYVKDKLMGYRDNNLGIGEQGPSTQLTIDGVDDKGNTVLNKLIVTPENLNGQQILKVQYQTPNGLVPLDLGDGKSGIFFSPEDLAEYLYE